MRYSGLIPNDITAAPGLCLSFFVQGCPHKCKNCQNPETWNFDGGLEFTTDTLTAILEGLTAQGINRTFCLMGGEPLCPENLFLSYLIITTIKEKLPNTPIYVWTGYLYEELLQSNDPKVKGILDLTDCLIDGPYIEELRDLTLEMRGSSNQRIIYLKN